MSPLHRKPAVFADIEPRVEQIRKSPQKWQRLSEDDRLFILWAKSKGYSEGHIASVLGRSKSAVRKFYRRMQESPLIIFDQKYYDVLGKKRLKCRFCEDVRESEMRIQRHVLAHFVPYEFARDMSLDGIRKCL